VVHVIGQAQPNFVVIFLVSLCYILFSKLELSAIPDGASEGGREAGLLSFTVLYLTVDDAPTNVV
jgi:hypothetical protein